MRVPLKILRETRPLTATLHFVSSNAPMCVYGNMSAKKLHKEDLLERAKSLGLSSVIARSLESATPQDWSFVLHR